MLALHMMGSEAWPFFLFLKIYMHLKHLKTQGSNYALLQW